MSAVDQTLDHNRLYDVCSQCDGIPSGESHSIGQVCFVGVHSGRVETLNGCLQDRPLVVCQARGALGWGPCCPLQTEAYWERLLVELPVYGSAPAWLDPDAGGQASRSAEDAVAQRSGFGTKRSAQVFD